MYQLMSARIQLWFKLAYGATRFKLLICSGLRPLADV